MLEYYKIIYPTGKETTFTIDPTFQSLDREFYNLTRVEFDENIAFLGFALLFLGRDYMTPQQFQDNVFRTANTSLSKKDQLLNSALGLGGESGEFLDLLKKNLYHGHELDKTKALKELGDCLFYITWASVCLDSSLEEVMQMNVDKLKARYPNGFNFNDSINRKDV